LKKFFNEINDLYKANKNTSTEELKKNRKFMAKLNSVINEFSKRLDEFYPFDLRTLMLMAENYPTGEFLLPLHYLPSILVLFLDKKNRRKIDFEYSRFCVEELPEILNPILKERKKLKKRGLQNYERSINLAIDAVDKKENTITIKIDLRRTRMEIIEDIKRLLSLLEKESNIFKIDLEQKHKHHWEEYDSFLRVYDLKKSNPQLTWSDISKIIYPDALVKNKKEDKDLAKPWAKDKVRYHYKRALEMIEGRWREI
jgi:hypothetical protein